MAHKVSESRGSPGLVPWRAFGFSQSMQSALGGAVLATLVIAATPALAVDCNDQLLASLRGRVGVESPIAAGYADTYVVTLGLSPGSCEASAARYRFMDGFFMGFRDPRRIVEVIPEVRDGNTGFQAGQKYRVDHPDSTDEVYASFGFSPVAVVGTMERRYEVSSFSPNSDYSGEKWWFEIIPRAKLGLLPGGLLPVGRPIRIKGYVSRRGRYGHLDGYDRQLYVSDLVDLPLK